MPSKETLIDISAAKEFNVSDNSGEIIIASCSPSPCNQPRPVPQPCGRPPGCRCTQPACRPGNTEIKGKE